MPELEAQPKHESGSKLVEGTDYRWVTYTTRVGGQTVKAIAFTPEGRAKKAAIKNELFPGEQEVLEVPLGKHLEHGDISQLKVGDILQLDGLLALSLIRKRLGGYVCTLTDNFNQLKEERYLARVEGINRETQTVRLLFDHWPDEFFQYEYVAEKETIVAINEPVRIGPELPVKFQSLADGRAHEDWRGWAKNAIKRNLLGRKRK